MTERTVDLPDVGEGELRRWLVGVGDRIESDQPLAAVETEEGVVSIPSTHAGVVTDLHAASGDAIPVGARLATVDVGDPDGDRSGDDTSATADRVFAPPRTRRLAREHGVDLAEIEGSGTKGRITDADVRAATEKGAATADGAGNDRPTPRPVTADATSVMERREAGRDRGDAAEREPDETADRATAAVPAEGDPLRDRTLASPATQRLADDLGVDIDRVPTDRARGGVPFVTPAMVREYAGQGDAEGDAESDAATDTGVETGAEPPDADTGTEGRDEGVPADADPGERTDAERPRPGDRVPYRGVRRTIGERLEQAAAEVPQVTHTDEVDVTALVEARADLADRTGTGVRVTYLPFVLKAAALALADHPVLNASLDAEREEIVYHDEYHLGVATATEAGLLVPVIRDVDERGVVDLAETVERKVERVRDRSLAVEEMRGGTFTVTNVGATGGRYATPIVNPPEVAVLALGRIERRPWVVDGDVVARHTLPLSLSVDHRVVDGAAAAGFTNRLMELLAAPRDLLADA
jgi:pyruvate dehydrogenase E2 component (dihydrolipoamide acetyltransferase)